MEEAFLHFVWQYGLFDSRNCRGTHGEVIEIMDRGSLNHHSGPDFERARIRIDSVEWYGNVEIHLTAGEWFQHHHQTDPAYSNTILHVVLSSDTEVFTYNKQRLVTLEIADRIPRSLYDNYRQISQNLSSIPCSRLLSKPSKAAEEKMYRHALEKRLLRKSAQLNQLLQSTQRNWQQSFYIYMCRYLGFKVNGDSMEQLAIITPLSLIMKNIDRPEITEALLFGQAGMLEFSLNHKYFKQLKEEYKYQKHKNNLVPMNPASWKFLRMRPVNFPTLRIAQLAAVLSENANVFSKLLNLPALVEMHQIFAAEPHEFWKQHYHFRKGSASHQAVMGKNAIDGLLINVVAPVWYSYGVIHHQKKYNEQAYQLLSKLPAEDNKITRLYTALGFSNQNAAHSQAILGLNEFYCLSKNCLQCSISRELLEPQASNK